MPSLVFSQLNFEVCVGVPNLEMVIDPLSCDYYYICTNGVGQLAQCPGGDHFDPENQWCASPDSFVCHLFAGTTTTTTTTTTVAPTRDPNVEEGIFCPAEDNPMVLQFLPSLIDCERYYICYYGQPRAMRCLEGFYWNQAKQRCDYPLDADCAVS